MISNKITTSVTTTTTKVIKLLPSLRRQLLTELAAAQKHKLAMKQAEEKYDRSKAKIRKFREQAGVETLEIDGYTTSNVTGVMTKFDEKLMLQEGLSMAQIEGFKVTTPKKPYEKVTFPSEKVTRRLLAQGSDYGD